MMTGLVCVQALLLAAWADTAPKSLEPALVIRATTTAAALPDRRFIFGRNGDRLLAWDALTGNLIADVEGGGGAIDPRSGTAILGNQVWDLEDGKKLFESEVPVKTLLASGVTPDGHFAAVLGRRLEVWDLPARRRIGRLDNPTERPTFLALSDTAGFAAIGRGPQFDVFEISSGRKAKVGALAAIWPFHKDPAKGFSEFVDDKARDFTVIWEKPESAPYAPQRPLYMLDWEHDPVNVFADRRPATGLRSIVRGTAVEIVWAVEGTMRTMLLGHDAKVTRVAFSPDRWTIATGDQAGMVRIWDIHSGELRYLLEGSDGAIQSLSYSPDAQFLLAATRSEIRVYAISP